MAERLTKKIVKTIQDKYSLGSCLYYDFAEIDDTNKLLNKLGKLEDILEKYGIGIDELENIIINGLAMLDIQKINVFKEMELKAELDTWKRACELACETMTKLGGDDCCGCRLNKEMCNICENKKALIDYFYQQAKNKDLE